MKHKLTKSLLGAACLLAVAASASPVAETDVLYAARAWRAGTDALRTQLGKGVDSLSTLTTTNGAVLYAVKMTDGGTVFMNSDDELEPVLGFTSDTNDFTTIDVKSPLWALLNRDVSGEHTVIRARAKQTGTGTTTATTSAKAAKWQALIAAGKLNRASSVSAASGISDLRVPALVQSKWSQDKARGQYCYSYYTPNHAVCGCVATAMSQIMRYHQYPTASVAAFTETCTAGKDDSSATNCVLTAQGGVYDWANMPLVPASATYNEDQWKMIGKLTSDAGIAVNMGYTDDDGSGAYGGEAGAAMKDHFGYSNAVYGEIGSRMASDSSTRADDLQRTLFSNFDAGLPVFVSVPGHAIVADGYGYIGTTDYVHFNMGWSGQDDYWYNIPDLTEAYDSFTAIDSVNYNIFTTNAAGSAVMSGRVLNASGAACAGVTVTVSTGSGAVAATATTSDTGVWGVILPAGTYSVQAAVTSASGTLKSTAKSVTLSAPTTRSVNYVNRTVAWASTKVWGNSWGNDVVVATATYARYQNGAFTYYDADMTEVTAPEGGMNATVTILFSTDAEYQALAAVEETKLAKCVQLEADVTLSTVTDWRTLPVEFAGHTVTLTGTTLKLSNMPASGTVTGSDASVLNVDVPEGASIENTGLTLTGGSGLSVLKTGKGLLTMSLANTGFGADGATSLTIREGSVCKPNGNKACGAAYSRIVVEDGGQIDIGKRGDHDYDYTLAGTGPDGSGALVNNTYDANPGYIYNSGGYARNMSLAADAAIGGTQPFSLGFWTTYGSTFDLNGYTLTITNNEVYSAYKTYNGPGRIVVGENACFHFSNEGNGTQADAPGVTLEVRGTMKENNYVVTSLSNLLFAATGSFAISGSSSPNCTVYDTYAPPIAGTSPTVTLGAAGKLATTLDLSLATNTFDAASTTFYSGSTVTVKLGTRALAAGQQLVGWSTVPSATFTVSGDNVEGLRLVSRSTGLYLIDASASVPVYAKYVNGAFTYYDESKVETDAPAGGLNADITVLFGSDDEYQALTTVSSEVAKAGGLELESNITLTNNTDWTALDFSLGGYSLNVANYKLDVANPPGSGTITYSSVNMIKNGTFEADTVTDGTGVAMCPTDWSKGGTVYVWKNWHSNGDTQCNSSTWIFCNSGGYVTQSFVAPHDGTYTISFNHAPWNSATGCAWSGAYAQVDGTSVFTTWVQWWGTATCSKDVTLNAGTHTLKIGCNGGWGFNFDNVSVVGTGILNFNVPEGGSVTNSETTVAGGSKLQVWKTGKGALRMSKVNTGFGANGSTSFIVKEGTVNKASGATCGAQYSRIAVEDGGQIDIAGRNYHDYDYTLAGAGPDGLGALVSRTSDGAPWWTNGTAFMRNITLVGDAKLGGTTPFSMAFWNSNPNTTTLNGHTLTLGNTTIYSGTMSFAGVGTVYVAEGATYCFNDFWNGTVTIKQGTLRVGGTLNIGNSMISEASNLVFTATGKFAASVAKSTTVYDTYAPNLTWTSSKKHPTITLGTTSSMYTTLDLSLFTDTFDGSTTTFCAGSYVTVALGSRALTPGQKLVSWSTKPSVTAFVGTGDNLGAMRLLAKDDGLYVLAEPAWAEWDLNNDCWKYFTQDGEAYPSEWTEGVTSDLDVHFSSFAEFEAIKAQGVSPAKYVLTKLELASGRNVYDFTTGFDFVLMPNMVIDLQGNTVKLPTCVTCGKIPFTVTDTGLADTATAPDILSDACFWLDAMDKSTMSIDADNKVQTWTSKDANHVVATAVSAPTYNASGYTIPTVDFGAAGSGLDMGYTRFTNLRTVFWVMKIAKTEAAFFLGDLTTYQFHRGSSGQYGNTGYAKFASMWNGTTAVNVGSDYPSDTAFCVYSATMSENVNSDRLTSDRACNSNGVKRNGGRQLSELICFSSVLSDADRLAVTAYLQQKWFTKNGYGTLVVYAPEGASVASSLMTVTGRVKVVKEGAGTFTLNKASQSYAGDTEVSAGQLTLGNNSCLGASGNTVTVDADATLELNGKGDLYNYAFVLNGGTLQNTVADVSESTAQINKLSLTADSTFKPTCSYGLLGPSYAATTLDLGGHTLTVPIGSDKYFWLYNATVTAGTIDLTSGGWLKVDKTAVSAGEATFRVNCGLNVVVPFTAGGYEALYSGTNNAGTGVMTVKQTFKPTSAYYRGVTLADGATIDLSACTDVLPSVSSFTAGPNALVYPTTTNATEATTLSVELHGRRLTQSKIIDWEAAPENVNFVPTEQTKKDGRSLEIRANGLYVFGGTVLFFR